MPWVLASLAKMPKKTNGKPARAILRMTSEEQPMRSANTSEVVRRTDTMEGAFQESWSQYEGLGSTKTLPRVGCPAWQNIKSGRADGGRPTENGWGSRGSHKEGWAIGQISFLLADWVDVARKEILVPGAAQIRNHRIHQGISYSLGGPGGNTCVGNVVLL